MLDIIQRTLGWLLTIEIVGLLASWLAILGIPPMFGAIIVIVGLLLLIRVIVGDRYMLQRWRYKFRRWWQR